MANLGDISKINLPNGNVVNIKDATARTQANWNTNNGVKNFATINNFSNTGYYKDVPVDGQLSGYVTIHIDSVTSTDTDANTCALIVNYVDGTSSQAQQISRGVPYTWTLDFGTHVIKDVTIYPSNNYVHSSGDTVTVTNLMVCPKSLYVADSTYEPYAMSNVELTNNILWTKTTLQYSATAADTYEYTGLSIACPANTLMEIWAIDDNSNCCNTAIAVTDSNTSIDTVGAVIGENAEQLSMDARAQWAREVHCVTPRLYSSVHTYYVWVKRGSTGANNVTLLTRKIVTQ